VLDANDYFWPPTTHRFRTNGGRLNRLSLCSRPYPCQAYSIVADPWWPLLEQQSGFHAVKSHADDNVGNVIAVTDARAIPPRILRPGKPRASNPSPLGAIRSGSGIPSRTCPYDSNGNVLTLIDPNNHITANLYDSSTACSPHGCRKHRVSNAYDAAGNRLSVTVGKLQTTAFAYDGFNRNTSVTDPAGHAVTFAYDAMTKMSRTDSLSQVTSYSYDDRHRLLTVTYPGRSADNRIYTYDPVATSSMSWNPATVSRT